MRPTCSRSQHLSRRALLKGALVAAGGVVMNWGGLTGTALGDSVRKEQKHCILLWMNGGASQFETFDMKPGRPTGGPYRPIGTNVPGIQICELMPKMAQQMDKVAVIRSMRTSEVDHPGGIYLMHTGYRPSATVRFPEIGAIVAKYQGQVGGDLPDFVKIFSNGYSGSGFLGPKYQPFSIGPDGSLPPFSASPLEAGREQKRHELRSFLEDRFAEEKKAELAKMHREAYEAARRLHNGRPVVQLRG